MNDLVKIQTELHAPKSQKNSFGNYNYRNCEDILEAVKPLLLKYAGSLTVTDEIKEAGSFVYVQATAFLSFGDQAKDGYSEYSTVAQAGIEKAGGMALPQAFGAASSYARKYALAGLFLLDDNKDADSTETHAQSKAKQSQHVHTPAVEVQKSADSDGNVVEHIVESKDGGVAGSADEVEIHFGKNKGRKLGDLSAKQLTWYRDTWAQSKILAWDQGEKKWPTDADLVRALMSYGNPEDASRVTEAYEAPEDTDKNRYDDESEPDPETPF